MTSNGGIESRLQSSRLVAAVAELGSFGGGRRAAELIMSVSPKQSILSLLSLFSQIASISVVVVGVSVLLGWLVKSDYLKSVIPGLATMKANTALAFLSAGAALWTLRRPAPTRVEKLAGRLLAALVVAIAALTLAEYIAAVDFGIDQLLFRDGTTLYTSHPGRMAPATALNFILAGFAIFILEAQARISQWFAVAVLIVSTLAVVGYAFGVSSLYQLAAYSSMAIHTAVAFAILAIGIMATRPTNGFMAVVASDSAGGILARRLLPLTPLIIFFLGALRLAGEEQGFYDGRFGVALMVLLSMVTTTLLIAITARVLYRVDLRRKQAEDEIKALNEDLERKVEARTKELRESLASVKQLEGLLPICAWCKKIRDDKDYWHSVETYVSERTDARFSHGMCPECLTKAMPESKQH
jgi:hypothetical protein